MEHHHFLWINQRTKQVIFNSSVQLPEGILMKPGGTNVESNQQHNFQRLNSSENAWDDGFGDRCKMILSYIHNQGLVIR